MEWDIVWQKPGPGIFILIVGVLSTGIAFYQYYGAEASARKNENLTKEVLTKQGNSELLQKETIKKIEGYGWPSVVPQYIDMNRMTFILENTTPYPIIDINILCNNYLRQDTYRPKVDGDKVIYRPGEWNRAEPNQAIFNLSQNNKVNLPVLVLLNKNEHFITFKVGARNMTILHCYYIRWDENTQKYLISKRLYDATKAESIPVFISKKTDPFDDQFWNDHFYVNKYLYVY
jgi:hypothetical protein